MDRRRPVLFLLDDDWRNVVDESDEGRPISRREYEDIDAFAGIVGARTELNVSVGYDDGASVPESGVLVCEEHTARAIAERWTGSPDTIYPRIFLINVGLRPNSIRQVELFSAAGAIERARFRVWRDERDDDPPGGVFGRKDVAARMGAQWRPSQLSETDRYCFFDDPANRSLPELLGAYLDEYLAAGY